MYEESTTYERYLDKETYTAFVIRGDTSREVLQAVTVDVAEEDADLVVRVGMKAMTMFIADPEDPYSQFILRSQMAQQVRSVHWGESEALDLMKDIVCNAIAELIENHANTMKLLQVEQIHTECAPDIEHVVDAFVRYLGFENMTNPRAIILKTIYQLLPVKEHF